jgi:hypothetical protein
MKISASLTRSVGETVLADHHQFNSLIATVIVECRKDHPDYVIGPEEAKQIAKCILEALADAGLQITPVDER